MSIVTSFALPLDMTSWGYRGLEPSQLTVAGSAPSVIDLNSSFDPYALVSVPNARTYALYLQLRGHDFGDTELGGSVPQTGVVAGATIANQFGDLVRFDQLNMQVGEFLDLLASRDAERLREALMSGDDEVNGSAKDVGFLGSEGDHLLGLSGNDTISGHGGHDTLDGGLGDDLIRTTDGNGASASRVDGGAGLDTLAYDQSEKAVIVDLAMGTAGADTVASIERVIGSAFADSLSGTGAADTLAGGGGADSVSGLGGADLIVGAGGATIDGGSGLDTISYAQASAGVVADLGGGAGADHLLGVEHAVGSAYGDLLHGSSGADTFESGLGDDTVDGGAGDDVIFGSGGRNYLRGGEGNDSIVGGAGFDDINGNMGDDTCVSGGGDDWVVGGKDNDSLSGSDGTNLVYGNLGSDTCEGGAGNDTVRGGQQNDIVNGGAGNDFVSGDKGDDTVSGGAGADLFHSFGDAGIDRVTDFHLSEGDRVMMDPGTQYTVAQVGADTVISITGGAQVILVGVQMSTLTGDWIFGA